jgi:dethiobiotin synthetase
VSVLVVTGTSTGVGKTVATAALAAAVGVGVAVVKPVQTGVGPDEPGDLAEVRRLSGCTDLHEFARYPDPLSPDRAAWRSGMPALGLAETASRIVAIAATRRLVLVEGAGGLLVPYGHGPGNWTIADLAGALHAPVVLVTAAELGTINHTLLTVRALAAAGLTLAGIVIGSWPAEPGLAERCNAHDLAALTPDATLAGVLPAGLARAPDFPDQARRALAACFGGTFDLPAFLAAQVVQTPPA